jgi:hypothetical protein
MLLERGTPSLIVEIEETKRRLIVDTGSNISILKPGVSNSDIMGTPLQHFGVTEENLDVKGCQTVTFMLGGNEFKHTFLVCPYGSRRPNRRRLPGRDRCHFQLPEL